MKELGIFTLHLRPGTALFDDAPVRDWLSHRELLSSHAHFFDQAGRMCLGLVLEARRLTTRASTTTSRPRQEPPANGKQAEREQFRQALAGLNETQRASYERLRARDHGQQRR